MEVFFASKYILGKHIVEIATSTELGYRTKLPLILSEFLVVIEESAHRTFAATTGAGYQ